jgi:hypothetical protein
MIRYSHILILAVAMTLMVHQACKKDTEFPENPYDKVDYGNVQPRPDTLNPASLAGLHRNVFVTKCAVPGCHDGNFEPDFRTVQSSYSTLVYAPIIKNNIAESFFYRVIPGDTAASVLYERITNCCFVNTNDRMPQDNIGTALPDADISNIAKWILDGAKDINGNTPSRPDMEPTFPLYGAANNTFNVEYSAASNREDSLITNPFRLPSGIPSFFFAAFIKDDHTPISEMKVNQLKLSKNMNDFSNAISVTAAFFNVPGEGPVWVASVPTAGFNSGETWYMRYYVNDGYHQQDTEFPKNSSQDYYKTYWSFIVQP